MLCNIRNASVFVLTIWRITSCLAGEGDVAPSVDKQLAQLESLWAAGKTNEYCEEAFKISHDLGQGQSNYVPLRLAAKVREAAKLLRSFSDKEFAVKGSGVGLLPYTEIMALWVAPDYQLPPLDLQSFTAEERQTNGTLLAQYLGHIRSEQIPDFKPLLVFKNIMPPGVPPGQLAIAGMDPNGISDPVARSNYLRAIQLNGEKALTNARQSTLGQIENIVSRRILNHMISTIQQTHVPPALVAQWMDSAKLNEEERNEVKAAMDKAASKN